jgi:hypothetical protein
MTRTWVKFEKMNQLNLIICMSVVLDTNTYQTSDTSSIRSVGVTKVKVFGLEFNVYHIDFKWL